MYRRPPPPPGAMGLLPLPGPLPPGPPPPHARGLPAAGPPGPRHLSDTTGELQQPYHCCIMFPFVTFGL